MKATDAVVDVHEVESSVIRALGYNPNTKTLGIVFMNYSLYHYLRVPREVYERLLGSKSKGEVFAQLVRDKYEVVRVRMPKKGGTKGE